MTMEASDNVEFYWDLPPFDKHRWNETEVDMELLEFLDSQRKPKPL